MPPCNVIGLRRCLRAPPTFSMTICCPSVSLKPGAMMRPTVSMLIPCVNEYSDVIMEATEGFVHVACA